MDEKIYYDHKKIEQLIQKKWETENTYYCDVNNHQLPKYYVLDMFPYPSANGLHVGHPRGYSASDVIARYKRLNGFNVLHPIGFDAFGLPAEQFAIKNNIHPSVAIEASIAKFSKQLKAIGFSYDWSKVINTTDSNYYKWTQWIFNRLYERGLAYEADLPVNWCPDLGTVLANEEVVDGKSEIGGFPVIRKNVRQWVLKITDYAERLLTDLDLLDWPSSTIAMQRNWIGKSNGADVDFLLESGDVVTVYTTRVDTLYGCTYIVLAPDHHLVDKINKADVKTVKDYQQLVASKSDLERETNKDKTGVFLNTYAINPINNQKIPVFIADYVLSSYGHGAVMAVPAHDERDYQFAKKYNLAIVKVIEADISETAFVEDGLHINSDDANNLNNEQAAKVILEKLEKAGKGRARINYKLRDWIFSRQRYWGEPIPIIHLEDGNKILETDLPLTIPQVDDYKPSNTGEPPLAKATDWVNVEVNGQKGKREVNTMPQWAGSCWYYLRYLDPNNADEIADKKILDHWLPVDFYIGGAEHSVLHLLYARFWHKVLYDVGLVSCPEPFAKLFHQGMILGENGEKMSKSRGNVINPDDVIEESGADTLRLYELFLGPLDSSLPWSTTGMQGCRRFLERVYRLCCDPEYVNKFQNEKSHIVTLRHQSVKKISKDIEALQFNTALSQLMIFVNELYKHEQIYYNDVLDLLIMLHPFAPHLATYLYQKLTNNDIEKAQWPTFNEEQCREAMKHLPVQINGKMRGFVDVAIDASQQQVLATIVASSLNHHLNNKQIVNIIYVPGKIINIIVSN